MYLPSYSNSRALIIGINKYQYCSPLEYAVNDARAVSQLLQEHFEFPSENIKLLLDSGATREQIHRAFLSYAEDGTDENDRLLVFFAGHGDTRQGRRGDIGYLIPVDGKSDDIATFLRWGEFEKNSELVRAKHILFIMDACYSGLAIIES